MKSNDSWSNFLNEPLRASRKAIKHINKFLVQRIDRLHQVKRPFIGWVLLVVLIATVSMVQWVLLGRSLVNETGAIGGSYSEGVLGPLESLNPIYARSSAEKSAARLLFSSLYQYDKSGHLKGDLARSISVNDAETEYTLTLKDNLRWSDGEPLTVDDVLFTTTLLRDPATKSDISGWRSIKVEKSSDKSIKFILPSPYAPFAHALTFPILPKHILSNVSPANLKEHNFNMNPVGSGLFKIQLSQNLSSADGKIIVHMDVNKNYHGGRAKLERFKLYVYPSKDSILDGLKASEIVATPELYSHMLPENIKQKYNSTTSAINDGVYALFNMRSERLKSLKVRQSLSLAVDRGLLRKDLPQPTLPLDGPLVTSSIDGNFVKSEKPNIEVAKKLLDDEGWLVVDGVRSVGGEPAVISVVVMKDPAYEEVAKNLIDIWQKELNIKSELRVVDPLDTSQSVLQTVLQPRDFDVLVYQLMLGGDPDIYAYWHSSQATAEGLNLSNYNNVVADEALASGRSLISSKLRQDRYDTFVKKWQADVPAIPLYQPEIDYIGLRSTSALNENSTLVSPADRYNDVLYWAVNSQQVYKTP